MGSSTVLVHDELGNGFPVAYCIASVESGDHWVEFIEAVCKGAGLE